MARMTQILAAQCLPWGYGKECSKSRTLTNPTNKEMKDLYDLRDFSPKATEGKERFH